MKKIKLKSKIDAIREQLSQPIPEPSLTRKEKKVATKKKGKSKKVSKKVSKKSGAKKAKKESKSKEGVVTLKQLADEAGISGQKARQKLRAAEIEREEGGRWEWKDGSKALKAARKAISGGE